MLIPRGQDLVSPAMHCRSTVFWYYDSVPDEVAIIKGAQKQKKQRLGTPALRDYRLSPDSFNLWPPGKHRSSRFARIGGFSRCRDPRRKGRPIKLLNCFHCVPLFQFVSNRLSGLFYHSIISKLTNLCPSLSLQGDSGPSGSSGPRGPPGLGIVGPKVGGTKYGGGWPLLKSRPWGPYYCLFSFFTSNQGLIQLSSPQGDQGFPGEHGPQGERGVGEPGSKVS